MPLALSLPFAPFPSHSTPPSRQATALLLALALVAAQLAWLAFGLGPGLGRPLTLPMPLATPWATIALQLLPDPPVPASPPGPPVERPLRAQPPPAGVHPAVQAAVPTSVPSATGVPATPPGGAAVDGPPGTLSAPGTPLQLGLGAPLPRGTQPAPLVPPSPDMNTPDPRERLARAMQEATVPDCLSPDATRLAPARLGPVQMVDLMKLPFVARAAAKGKCK